MERDLAARGATDAVLRGTLVFADLSDFTPLTERLARRGQVGSEQLTDLLSAIFGPMLTAAATRGGDLLKFGGDALLLLFAGPEHESVGVTAAFEMQDILRTVARRERVDVAMSVGVASGEIWLHLVGELHRVLVVTGPAVECCLELESAAAPGEVRVTTDATGEFESGPAASSGHADDRLDRIALLDPQVAAAVDAGASPEHRRAVIAFIAVDLDPLASRSSSHDRLATVIQSVQASCRTTDVCLLNCDVRSGGIKLTLTAGVPLTTGDDADRMLQCVTGIVAECSAAGIDLRVGVNEGRVYCGPVGSESRRCYTIMGDAVNAAARVMARADPGVVLATEAVLDRTREQFDRGDLTTFTVKGKKDPVTAGEVRQWAGQSVPRATAGPLRGRDDELRLLTDAAGSLAADRPGSVIEVSGPPGIGKSRLVREAIVSMDRPPLIVECGRYLSSSPYGAVIECFKALLELPPRVSEQTIGDRLRELVELHAPELTSWLPLLGIPLGVEMNDTSQTAALHGEFRVGRAHRVFGTLVVQAFSVPRVIVIEDAHWLDSASGELLDAVVPALVGAGWSIVVTRRPEQTGWRPQVDVVRHELAPIESSSVHQLAIELSQGHRLPAHVVSTLADRSNGNPLFLEELIRAVAAGAAAEDLPDRIEVLIEAHIDRLTPVQRRSLQAGAVLGARFDAELFEDLPGASAADLGGLADFVTIDEGEIRFRHALYRDTAYQTLPVKERRRLHTYAAEALEVRAGDAPLEFAELLAVHWFNAACYDRAWEYLRAAGARARTDLAPYEASQFLERAVQCVRHLGPAERAARFEVEEELGLIYDTLARYDDAERCLRNARRHAPDASARARIRGHEGRIARSNKSLSTSLRRYRTALTEVPDDAHGVRAQLLVGVASVLERQGRHADKLPYLNEAVAAATKAADDSALAHAHLLLGNTLGDLGTGDAEPHLTTALVLFEQLEDRWGVASARNNLGVEAYYAGNWLTALDHYEAALAAFRLIGDEFSSAILLNNIGEIHSDQGEYERAESEFHEARRLWSGSDLGVAFVTSNLGLLYSRTGQFDRALAEFEVARAGLVAVNAGGYLLELDVRVAEMVRRCGDAMLALESSRRILDGSGELQPTVRCQVLRTCGLAEQDRGRIDAALGWFDRAIELANEHSAVFERALTMLARSELVDDGASRREATNLLEGLGVREVVRGTE